MCTFPTPSSIGTQSKYLFERYSGNVCTFDEGTDAFTVLSKRYYIDFNRWLACTFLTGTQLDWLVSMQNKNK